jgi:hypothetical protein
MLSLMFAASPVPWRTAWTATARTHAAEENLGHWLADAQRLFEMIGVAPPAGGLRVAA